MPLLKTQSRGARNKTSSVHQANFCYREVDPSCNARGSLEIFGGGQLTSSLLFSRTRSAWKDALQCADSRLHSTGNVFDDQDTFRVAASVADTCLQSPHQQVTVKRLHFSSDRTLVSSSSRNGFEDDVSKWLASAETSESLVKTSTSSVSKSLDYGSDGLDSNDSNREAISQRLSEFSVTPAKTTAEHDWGNVLQLRREKNVPGLSDVEDEALSARAAQWGYGVVLKPSDHRGSGSLESERISGLSWTTGSSDTSHGAGKSSRTTSEESSACSAVSSMIPGVSKNVKEALASFQLAFVVCDALNADYPILYASAGFFSMTGYCSKEVVGRNCRFLQGQYTDAHDISMIRDALKGGNIYTGKLLNYKKDGSPFWNLLTISPIRDDGGRLIKYIGMQAEVTEGCFFEKDVNQSSLPAGVERFLEAEGRNGISNHATDGGVLPAPSAPYKSSVEQSEVPRTVRLRYSLSSSSQSFEVLSNTASAQDYQAAAKMKAEVAVARTGTVDNGRLIEVAAVFGGKGGCTSNGKSSKRTSGLIKIFKKLNGRFSLSKRAPRECSDEDRFVMDDRCDVVSDPDDGDLEYIEHKQPRSSMYSSTLLTVGKQELDKSCETSSGRRRGSQLCDSEKGLECSSTSATLEKAGCESESSMRKNRLSGTYVTGGTGVHEPQRSFIGYGRRSAQYPVVRGQAGLEDEGLTSDRSDRRHSLATFTSAGSILNFGGRSQFCIVHPTVPESNGIHGDS